MCRDTYRRFVSLVLPTAGMSLAVTLYGAPPWPVIPLLMGISLLWWGSIGNADSEARPFEFRIRAASERRKRPC